MFDRCAIARWAPRQLFALGVVIGVWGSLAQAGIQFVDQTSSLFPSPNPSEYTNQLTFGDLNGDGHLDIVFANGSGFGCPVSSQIARIYINDGSADFSDETFSRSANFSGRFRGVELGDIEQDGDLDILLVPDCSNTPGLLVNDGAGFFVNQGGARLPGLTMSSSRGQFLDIDNDGDLDLFFCNGGSSRFGSGPSRLYENDGNGFYTDVSSTGLSGIGNVSQPMDVSVADVDGDFDIDVNVGSRASGGSRLYKNNGSGVFSQVTFPADGATYSYDFGDIDGDGDLDMLGANAGSSNAELLLRNNGTGSYSMLSFPFLNADDNDSKFLDFNNDGDLDLLVARIGGAERAYTNNGNGTFTLASNVITAISDSTLDIMVGDLDSDGDYDVITGQGESGAFQNRIFINNGGPDTIPPNIVDTEQLADTKDTAGPYVVRTLILDHMSSDRNFFDKGIFLNYAVDGGDTNAVDMVHSGGQVYRGEIPGIDGGTVEYWVTAFDSNNNEGTGASRMFEIIGSSCKTFADCADVDGDLIRDDNCLWWSCDGVNCTETPIVFADMGGQFGECGPDGVADANDRFQALNCFADQDVDSNPGAFPCEELPPTAFNVDAGSPFGVCAPDGVCDANDAFHALNSFGKTNTCTCPSDPAPGRVPTVEGKVAITLSTPTAVIQPGALFSVDVHLNGSLTDFRGYQLHVSAAGGRRGQLELIDVAIEDDAQHVFGDIAHWSAFNTASGQMTAGLDSPGIATAANAYLATFTYRADKQAAGSFLIQLLHDHHNAQQRTFLFPTVAHGRIAISAAPPLAITVAAERSRER